jgi:hypothetical protein
MRLPPMTTRSWMVAVAVVALVLSGIVGLKQRQDNFAYRAQWHRIIVATLRARRAARPNDTRVPRLMVYRQSLVSKHQHAARCPWLPVESTRQNRNESRQAQAVGNRRIARWSP